MLCNFHCSNKASLMLIVESTWSSYVMVCSSIHPMLNQVQICSICCAALLGTHGTMIHQYISFNFIGSPQTACATMCVVVISAPLTKGLDFTSAAALVFSSQFYLLEDQVSNNKFAEN
eukprot:TRINITY_DN2433_c0_g2_i1.p1 TRINITY_DN2433_c0_g2~~TRINITY_DN2433_c0_g2_i1.p1  ORF type:complete len:118 (-),score=8.87 TRINITY_DN2433_c0_g2_i1:183-536(-)